MTKLWNRNNRIRNNYSAQIYDKYKGFTRKLKLRKVMDKTNMAELHKAKQRMLEN
jgi:hypothetical protein